MYLRLLIFLIFSGNMILSRSLSRKNIKNSLNRLRRRNTLDYDVSDIPESVEDLPRAEPVKPGHTLLQPSSDSLKSAMKYPQNDASGTAVYGNLDNLGITFGKTNERVTYTGFRKSNDLLVALLRAMQNIQQRRDKRISSLLVLEIDPRDFTPERGTRIPGDEMMEIDNNASEILDRVDSGELEARRKNHKTKPSKFRNRDIREDSSSSDSSSSRSSDYERNPGNPYTVHKDKYHQNWLWNHYMDGDHMNVNPYAPQFNSAGPSGAALFFGRKWWYFNQDDYMPLN